MEKLSPSSRLASSPAFRRHAVVLASAVATALAVFGDLDGPVRFAIVLWFFMTGPGIPIVSLLRVDDKPVEIILIVGVSFAVDLAVTIVLLLAGAPSPELALGVLLAITLAALTVDVVLSRRTRRDTTSTS